ncbi:FAD-binding oxidoreductase [Variovorax sp. J22P271]|uniref:FAD-binding oxidoreductase n=1 Tax=Variovorax davisae TaxID=3053515 RepID=UPI0025785D47|nr:FAD-binding oxidoreductase [Variovorax sp. J22P271]MDM0031842.1 FAD-binding oxidoreductase [Variovorax sp. J22P271]
MSAQGPTRWQEAMIERIAPVTPRIASVILKADLARHVSGQHLDVRLTAPDGYTAQRSYSIASAPGEPVELLVEKLDDGEVSPYFHDIAQAGDAIEVRGPLGGHFIWRAEDGGPVLLVAGGSGIAPLMAMVRDWARTAVDLPLMLVCSARTWDELACRDELLGLEASRTGFRFVAAITRGPVQRAGDRAQRLDAAALKELIVRWGHLPRHVLVCGSNRFVEGVTRGLADATLAAGMIRTERYGGAE